VLGIYLANLAWTLVATWPFYEHLAAATAARPYAAILGRGLHLDVLAEVMARRPGVDTAAQAGLAVGVLGWLVIGWFLTAGILGVLRSAPTELSLRRFAALAATGGFAMARLQLLSVVPYLAATGVLLGGGALGGFVAWRTTPDVRVLVGAAALGAAPGLALWLATKATLDLARARAVLGDEPEMWRVLLRAFRLVWAFPRGALGLQVGGGLLFWALTGIYLAVAWPWPYAGTAAFAALTLIRQALVFGRTGVRVAVLGGSLELVLALDPTEPAVATPGSAAVASDEGTATVDPRPVS
jgi:hypothetical protein